MHAAAPTGDPPAPTLFEQQRLARISRNRQVLAGLGLEELPQQLAGAAKGKRSKQPGPGAKRPRVQSGEQQEPTRKSRRLQQQQPEEQQGAAHGWLDDDRQAQQDRKRRQERQERQQAVSGSAELDWSGSQLSRDGLDALLARDGGNPHHAHNIHRLRSMSAQALLRRVWKITNTAKLDSLCVVLEAGEGPAELLAAAREARERL